MYMYRFMYISYKNIYAHTNTDIPVHASCIYLYVNMTYQVHMHTCKSNNK